MFRNSFAKREVIVSSKNHTLKFFYSLSVGLSACRSLSFSVKLSICLLVGTIFKRNKRISDLQFLFEIGQMEVNRKEPERVEFRAVLSVV